MTSDQTILDTAAAVSIKSIFDALHEGLKWAVIVSQSFPACLLGLLANKKMSNSAVNHCENSH